MKTLKFKCTLVTDVVLNVKSASEGTNQTLDFIPGANFLGIVANKLYNSELKDLAKQIVHSGHVRFGDAHIASNENRTNKVPASLFVPKLEKDKFYIFHKIPDPSSEEIRRLQIKQCRKGYYDFSDPNNVKEIDINNSFAIKSARDKNSGASEEGKMFGYESLDKGQCFYFSVEIDDDSWENTIISLLTNGNNRLGRSKTAQYGLVKIEQYGFNEVTSTNGSITTVYADSRLIFLDKYGLPTFQPNAKDLGCGENAEIEWETSQIRTFQYSPWNFKRQCFDTDRCGIEKGSVFVIKNGKSLETDNKYIGKYNNEGFGKIIYNPSFLDADEEGKSALKFAEKDKKDDENTDKVTFDCEYKSHDNASLFLYLNEKLQSEQNNHIEIVNNWIKTNKELFLLDKNNTFASQWGAIRDIVSNPKTTNENVKQLIDEYISHGIAKEKWEDLGRKEALLNFLDKKKDLKSLLVNLASEMGKICKK